MKKFFLKIYLILTLDCEGSARITSDSFDRKLDWSEKIAASIHRLICSKSRLLNRQLVKLNSTLRTYNDHHANVEKMPEVAKKRIKDKLSGLSAKPTN